MTPKTGPVGMKSPLLATLLGLALLAGASPANAQDFKACVKTLRGEVMGRGVTAQTFDTALTGFEPDQAVLDAMGAQPEFTTPIWDYMAGLVDEQRVADGRAKLEEMAKVVANIEQKLGVDGTMPIAIWGIETDYGRNMGKRSLVRSLTTLSCAGGRQRFFRNELVETLRIVQSGDIAPEALTGSWAGAFGHTQFMPSTYQRLALDFDGDGRRDLIGTVADALGSTANYLKRSGWETSMPWGYEVRLPANYKGPSGRRNKQLITQWKALGIKRVDGSELTGPDRAALLLPTGATGPAFIVFRNFDAIYSYNPAEHYALAIAHLSDRLRGGGPLRTAWPTDDPGLSRAERRELQQLLIARGYDIGNADGILGSRTREAIKAFQASAGLPADAHPGTKVLNALRAQKKSSDK